MVVYQLEWRSYTVEGTVGRIGRKFQWSRLNWKEGSDGDQDVMQRWRWEISLECSGAMRNEVRWQGNERSLIHMALEGAVIVRVYIAFFLSVLSAHINFPACSKTPPTQLHYHFHCVTILIRLTYASVFSRVAFLLGMLGHWRWRQRATQKCYLLTDTTLCSRRKPAKVTEMYNHFRTVGWCPLQNLVTFHLVYTACHLQ